MKYFTFQNQDSRPKLILQLHVIKQICLEGNF